MKAIFIIAVSLVILAETGDLQVATEKLEAFREGCKKSMLPKSRSLHRKQTAGASDQTPVCRFLIFNADVDEFLTKWGFANNSVFHFSLLIWFDFIRKKRL